MAMSSPELSTDFATAGSETLFQVSKPSAFLDYFRVPYEVDPGLSDGVLEQLRPRSNGPSLFWIGACNDDPGALRIGGVEGQPEIPIFANVAGDQLVSSLLSERGRGWHPARTLADEHGTTAAAIYRSDDGSLFLPFDPDEVMVNYWSERYTGVGEHARGRRLRHLMMVTYYRLRPLLPRSLQIWLRRRFARRQARCTFPRWPVEPGLHDFFDLMFAMLAEIAGEPVPHIAPWPSGYEWTLVLTHDVEKDKGLKALDPVIDVELRLGLRSSWNLVANDYYVAPERVRALLENGFEVGVHGMHHDGRDLESLAILQERLPAIREARERWGAVGFRAPSLHRNWEWMRLLGFDYDSSWPDTDPFEPQNGGCCTWLPFFNGELVELPMTLTLDHTVFVILNQRDETAWVNKTEFLRERGGLALIDTHPDYLIDETVLTAYGNFLARYAADDTAWKALPREVSAWWRRRAASSLERDGSGWRVVGPAADEGRVRLSWGAS
jgi:hypothetical protein